MEETRREMWEIAENLHRVDLTKEERDNHIRRYAELLKLKRKPLKGGQDDRVSDTGGRGHVGIAQQVSDATGVSNRTVRRVLNPPDSTVPNEEADDQEKVYNNLCKWWRKADSNTREGLALPAPSCFARGMANRWR